MGVRCAVLGGLHLWRHALRQGQEPGGRGESPARTDLGPAVQLSQQGLRGEKWWKYSSKLSVTTFDLPGDEVMLGHGTRGQAKLQNYQGEVGCHQPRLERGLANNIEESESILYS